jgi:hypothetical protein
MCYLITLACCAWWASLMRKSGPMLMLIFARHGRQRVHTVDDQGKQKTHALDNTYEIIGNHEKSLEITWNHRKPTDIIGNHNNIS